MCSACRADDDGWSARRRGALLRGVFSVLAAAVPVAAVLASSSCAVLDRPAVPDSSPPSAGVPVPAIDLDAPGRSSDQLAQWAAPISDDTGIPATAVEAYGYAAAVMARSRPGCHLGWTTLAGIGAIESKHGRHRGSSLGPDGEVTPPIRGVTLDGRPGVAAIADTDGGSLDGDPVHDRAIGPMQFIPETWERWGVDANGDGAADPDNLDDAALTAGRYLCAYGRDLATAGGWNAALHSYNDSSAYARAVLSRANAYGVGVRP